MGTETTAALVLRRVAAAVRHLLRPAQAPAVVMHPARPALSAELVAVHLVLAAQVALQVAL